MKQAAYIFLVLALLVSLTSCASESSEAEEPPVSAASSEAAPAGQNQNDAEKDPILWSGETKTAVEAVAEMTWGVNLGEPFAGYSERRQGDPAGYNSGREPLNITAWFWNWDSAALCWKVEADTFTASVDIPDFDGQTAAPDWVGGLLNIGILSKQTDAPFSIALSDTKIVKGDGSEVPLNFFDGIYSSSTSLEADQNGWHDLDFCFYDEAHGGRGLVPGAEWDGARFETTVEVLSCPAWTVQEKVNYFYEYEREDQYDVEEMIDVYLSEGVNVIRLPVTWTSFIQDDTFEIDEEYLEAVREVVEYILSKGAYCILNMHNDYIGLSYVGDHWEAMWMEEPYREYVDARFAAVWEQIAEQFQDYSQKLIFEPFNEPAMAFEYYDGPDDYGTFFEKQTGRLNEMNRMFVDVVRKSGGKNKTRLLCMVTAEYDQYGYLAQLELPDDPYLITQIHGYNIIEDFGVESRLDYEYQANSDRFFKTVSDFSRETGVPVLIGEMGIMHQLPAEEQAARVSYFFSRAAENGVPCLWWEDFFYAEDNSQYWLYDKRNGEWGRPELLEIIKNAAVKQPS